jgi:hypothetical protein
MCKLWTYLKQTRTLSIVITKSLKITEEFTVTLFVYYNLFFICILQSV